MLGNFTPPPIGVIVKKGVFFPNPALSTLAKHLGRIYGFKSITKSVNYTDISPKYRL
jgi:hypothetical protein